MRNITSMSLLCLDYVLQAAGLMRGGIAAMVCMPLRLIAITLLRFDARARRQMRPHSAECPSLQWMWLDLYTLLKFAGFSRTRLIGNSPPANKLIIHHTSDISLHVSFIESYRAHQPKQRSKRGAEFPTCRQGAACALLSSSWPRASASQAAPVSEATGLPYTLDASSCTSLGRPNGREVDLAEFLNCAKSSRPALKQLERQHVIEAIQDGAHSAIRHDVRDELRTRLVIASAAMAVGLVCTKCDKI